MTTTTDHPDEPRGRPGLPPGLLATRLMVVLRAPIPDHVVAAAEALVGAGVRCLEVALTTPGAGDLVHELVERLPPTVDVGAGTVVEADQVREVVAAGARFVVAPTVDAQVMSACRRTRVACFPGAMSPTEVAAAWRGGACAVKLFPASRLGPEYLAELRGPFPDLLALPTGGVDADRAPAWLAAGAVAVGVGGPLLRDSLTTGDVRPLAARAAELLRAVEAPGRAASAP